MRKLIIVVACFAAMALTAQSALASNVHFKGGAPAPSFVKNADLSVTGTFTLAGLGNGDIRVQIDASGTGTATCTNPGGSSKVPGQNPVAINLSGIADFSAAQITNGSLGPISATTAAPTLPTPKQAGCPTNKWTVSGLSVTYTTETLSVYQDASGNDGVFDAPGTLVLGPVTFNQTI